MKVPLQKLCLSIGVFTLVTLGICFTLNVQRISVGWPELFPISVTNAVNDNFIIEKIVQRQQNDDDMRRSVYLKQHRYMLENIGKIEINYRQKSYTINDICFKPHLAIFEQFYAQSNIPQYYQRLLLEIERLSPCLVSTPLNCFHDSYLIHSQISKWNTSTDFLNRRLRNAFIEAQGEHENRPYVKSNYGPELIEKWSEYMFQLSSKNSESFQKQELSDKVKMWLSIFKTHQKVCVDSTHSCDENIDDEKYFNLCTEYQQNNVLDVDNKLNLDSEDREFSTQLDCVDGRQKFIEWMQERELRTILKSYALKLPDHSEMTNQNCIGIYGDANISASDIFDGSRYFSSEKASFDSLISEITLMKPEMLLAKLRHADYVNGFESIWTIERAEELLKEYRNAIRDEIAVFNGGRSSRMIHVATRISNNVPEEISEVSFLEKESTKQFLIIAHLILVCSFTIFVWSENRIWSTMMFFVRSAVTFILFALFCNSERVILYNWDFIAYAILSTVANLFVTTRASFCAHRLKRCIQRENNFQLLSNFSLSGSFVEGVSQRQVQYMIARYTKYQVAQDAYSEEIFEKVPKYWSWLSLLFFPIVLSYGHFVDSNCHTLLVVLVPSFIIAALEEVYHKYDLLNIRTKTQKLRKQVMDEMAQTMSRESSDNLWSGLKENELSANVCEMKYQPNESKRLCKLSSSQTDINIVVAQSNQLVKDFRYYAIGAYFQAIKCRKMSCLIWITALLFIIVACCLIFIPVQRETIRSNIDNCDLFIDFSIDNVSSNWRVLTQNLKEFNADIDSITELSTISNWHQVFERFNQNVSDINNYLKWIKEEPISWTITTPEFESSYLLLDQIPFKFRFRYAFKISESVADIRETIQKIDFILLKFSERLSPKASGILYEHYHQIAVVWDSFAINESIACIILIALFSLITVLFSITPTISSTLLFSVFVIGTRLEIAAIISIFSLENHQFYTNFAVLVGFLAAWTPFCDLARFRRRILYKLETRTTPELATRRRIRIPFIAAADVIHFFGTVLVGFIGFAIVSAIVTELNGFFWPTVILISIQLCALANSVAILVVTKQMFEQEVHHFIQEELRGRNTPTNTCGDLKLTLLNQFQRDSSPDLSSEEMTDGPIRVDVPPKFHAPPPSKKSKKKSSVRVPNVNDDEQEEKSDDVQPTSLDELLERNQDNRREVTQSPAPLSDSLRGETIFSDPVHLLMNGTPINSAYRVSQEQYERTRSRDEEAYEAGEDSFSDLEDEYLDYQVTSGRNLPMVPVRCIKNDNEETKSTTSENEPGPSDRGNRSARLVTGRDIPPMIVRTRPRNPLTDPPILEELIQEHDQPGLGPHPRADQYEAGLPRSIVAYCEDPYWNAQRDAGYPGNVVVPPRPFDYREPVRGREDSDSDSPAPPVDRNWVPEPGTNPIDTFEAAMSFRQRMRNEADQKKPGHPEKKPDSGV